MLCRENRGQGFFRQGELGGYHVDGTHRMVGKPNQTGQESNFTQLSRLFNAYRLPKGQDFNKKNSPPGLRKSCFLATCLVPAPYELEGMDRPRPCSTGAIRRVSCEIGLTVQPVLRVVRILALGSLVPLAVASI